MKKIFIALLLALLSVGSMAARDRVSRNINDLPAPARECIARNFPKIGVNHINIDSKFIGGDEYDVVLNDGTEIEFDAKGALVEVDRGMRAVPDAMVIRPIRDYVKQSYANARIVELKVDRNKYEVGLSNGVELEFDRAGKFLRQDD